MKEIEMVIPNTLAEALQILAEHGGKAQPVAGATNVLLELNHGSSDKELLVPLDKLAELRGICAEGDYIYLGCATTMTDVLKSDLVARFGAPLHEAAGLFATPMIRNRATPGGNLVDASPAADTAPALLAMGAEMELRSLKRTRWVPLDEFFTGVNQTVRQPDELLISIRWKKPAEKSSGGFTKIGLRKGMVCSILSASVYVEKNGDNTIHTARVALGAVAPKPIRAYEAETYLKGKNLNDETILEAGRLAAEAASPISDIRGSAEYRRKMSDILVRRVLVRLAAQLA